jgi:hypothetical protein
MPLSTPGSATLWRSLKSFGLLCSWCAAHEAACGAGLQLVYRCACLHAQVRTRAAVAPQFSFASGARLLMLSSRYRISSNSSVAEFVLKSL